MKHLKSLFLVIFLLFNLNCFAENITDIQSNEVSNTDIKDKNKHDTKDKHDVPDYISNPKEHAEKFYNDFTSGLFTVLFLLVIMGLYFAKGSIVDDSDENNRRKIGGGSRKMNDDFVGSGTGRWAYNRYYNRR